LPYGGGFREIVALNHIRSEIHERRCPGRRPHHSHVHSQRGGLRRALAISGARNDPMTTATITRSLSFAGAPLSAWGFGFRIWVAVVVALAAKLLAGTGGTLLGRPHGRDPGGADTA
jgi:hypothetical protein